ncbi:MAG TPA: UDP-N-acetylglucosamine 2-epimerase (non-hydrolyzing) [Solirubrobacterales bacterium]|nr:UDP-N-acetylglucosamine 2-epimerase (non-hydrolyzing) [Solirubrobacterales bacterium]
MRILTVVGNRPQFVKAAAVSRHLRRHATEVLVHSGQHYDEALSAVFFEELPLPHPDHMLGVGSGSHAAQTAATMSRLEPLVRAELPDAMLVYGDTNTTLAAALVGAKLPVPVVHVEAGMRSFDPSMPEEVNRVLADRLGRLLLCPTGTAVANLGAEGLEERARLVGDPMADVALELGPVARRRSTVLERLGLRPGGFLVATLHRAANVDEAAALARAVELLAAATASRGPLVLPLHPRTRSRLEAAGMAGRLEGAGVLVTEPLGYLDFSCLLAGARALLTDSGGLQKEAYLAGVPCLTLREETEWVELVESGWNRLVGLDREKALEALGEMLRPGRLPPPDPDLYGGGEAGERCVRALLEWGATEL